MKRSFAISTIAHIAFISLIIVPGQRKSNYAGLDVINVKLVAESRPVEKPKAEPPPPEQQKVVQDREPDKAKMTYKSQTKTRKTETKKTRPPEAKPEKTKPAPSKAASTGTSAGGTQSKVRVDDEDFRFAYYLEIVKERISSNWSPPPVAGSADGVMSTVYFKISRDGQLSDIKIEKTSEFDLFDRSAVRAVSLSSPLPPLPSGFRGRWLGVHFEFERKSG